MTQEAVELTGVSKNLGANSDILANYLDTAINFGWIFFSLLFLFYIAIVLKKNLKFIPDSPIVIIVFSALSALAFFGFYWSGNDIVSQMSLEKTNDFYDVKLVKEAKNFESTKYFESISSDDKEVTVSLKAPAEFKTDKLRVELAIDSWTCEKVKRDAEQAERCGECVSSKNSDKLNTRENVAAKYSNAETLDSSELEFFLRNFKGTEANFSSCKYDFKCKSLSVVKKDYLKNFGTLDGNTVTIPKVSIVEDSVATVKVNLINEKSFQYGFKYDNNDKIKSKLLNLPESKKINLSWDDGIPANTFLHLPAMNEAVNVSDPETKNRYLVAAKTGTNHFFVRQGREVQMGMMNVLNADDFSTWTGSLAGGPNAEDGKKLYNDQGCVACHSVNGTRLVGPSFEGLYNRDEQLQDGTSVKADDAYIKESIVNPNAKIVATYPAAMPSYEGKLTDDEISSITMYIKAVSGFGPPPEEKADDNECITDDSATLAQGGTDPNAEPSAEIGQQLYAGKACIGCHSLDGSKLVGPSFKGLFGRDEKISDGTTVAVDEAYLKESILQPNAKIVEGYPGAMPSYEGQLSENELESLVLYIKTIK